MADTVNIKRNLEAIINTPDYRNYKNITVLDTVAERIKKEFQRMIFPHWFENFLRHSRLLRCNKQSVSKRLMKGQCLRMIILALTTD